MITIRYMEPHLRGFDVGWCARGCTGIPITELRQPTPQLRSCIFDRGREYEAFVELALPRVSRPSGSIPAAGSQRGKSADLNVMCEDGGAALRFAAGGLHANPSCLTAAPLNRRLSSTSPPRKPKIACKSSPTAVSRAPVVGNAGSLGRIPSFRRLAK